MKRLILLPHRDSAVFPSNRVLIYVRIVLLRLESSVSIKGKFYLNAASTSFKQKVQYPEL